MANTGKVLAFDFGASSGRAMLFTFDGKKLEIEEMHRFSNDPVMINGSYHWDVLRLFFEIKKGISKTLNAGHKDIEAIGIDTWGVDYGLFDENGKLLGNPYHYRDERTNGMIELADEKVGKKYIFDQTGLQFNFFNTIFQLMAAKEQKDSTLPMAKKLLFIPDIFNYFLTGVMKNEYTESSTSMMLNPHTKKWNKELLDKLDIPSDILCDIIEPGTVLGELSDDICEELGCPKIPVIAVGSHDTASAVASVPVTEDYSYAYISTGTWALMGAELDAPSVTEHSFKYNFTNEGGVCGKIRFLKNIMGLWIIQECRRQWEREGKELSFDDLEKAAWGAAPFESFIDPDYHDFATPGNMPQKIRNFCEKTGQKIPQTEGEVIRCAAQSLAMKCRMVADALEDVQGKKLEAVHMLGGGIKDTMVTSFVSNATGKRVIAGPVEATSTGNAVLQLMALGKISSLTEARTIIRDSFPIKVYEPQDSEEWNAAYEQFKKIATL
ncbi:MAG: rhamnulokinase [Clostridia bacterium]|nr:rhamnulokinase [Clostridia bacterium]